jgi:hypothetical protein
LTSIGREACEKRSFTHDLDDDPALTRTRVELEQHDLLHPATGAGSTLAVLDTETRGAALNAGLQAEESW